MKWLLGTEESARLTVRTDYLGKSRFRGVWKEEAQLQCNETEPTFDSRRAVWERRKRTGLHFVSGEELGTASWFGVWVFVISRIFSVTQLNNVLLSDPLHTYLFSPID